MSSLKIRKVGNALGVIFPKELQETLDIVEGDVIDFTKVADKKVLLEAPLSHHSQWVFENPDGAIDLDAAWLDADLEDKDHAPKW